jgi:hypothetical protein
MKKASLFLLFVLTFTFVKAQDASVEKSIISIEAGFPSLWISSENRLANSFTLRTEIGLVNRVYGIGAFSGPYLNLSPVISIEPRFYNVVSRKAKGKDIRNNSGTFVGLQTSYSPKTFHVLVGSESPNGSPSSYDRFSIIPTVGIRRNITKNWFVEGSIGIGYGNTVIRYENIKTEQFNHFAPHLSFRLGYRF